MPDRYGRFEIIERVGSGAFGVVFKAWDPVLDRVVALKLPSLRTFASEELVERFVREAKIAARLDHGHIVRLLEADRIGEIWYLVSDFVDGPNLADWMKQQESSPLPTFAARLIRDLAEAIAYAHDQAIIHRDLKPANVLMEKVERDGGIEWQPKLTDFGLAKFVDSTASIAELTKTGQWVGTPSYMAPEQIDGKSEFMTPSTDVYGLGAVLYDLLTGKPPFTGPSAHDVMTQVKEADPQRPRLLRRQIPADLETICLKCLEKDPAKRYSSAKQVQEELQRFLDGRPILARPTSPTDKAVKWAKRNPTVAALLTTVAFSLVATAGGASYYAVEQARMNRELEQVIDRERRARRRSEQLSYASDMRIVSDELESGQIASAVDHLEQHVTKKDEFDHRGIEWYYAWNETHDWDRRLLGHEGAVYGIAFTPDGKTLVSVGADKLVRCWYTSTWQLAGSLSGHDAEINDLTLSPDGTRLMTGDDLGTICVWDLPHQKLVRKVASGLPRIASICWCPQVERIAAVGWTSRVALVDAETGQAELTELPSNSLRAVAPDDQATKLLALGDEEGDISLFDMNRRVLKTKWHAHNEQIQALRFRAGLYSASSDYTIKAWDAVTQTLLTEVPFPQDVYGFAITESKAFMLAASKNRIVYRVDHIVDPFCPRVPYPTARGHRDRVWSVAIHPTEACFASADRSGDIQVRDLIVATRKNEFMLPGVMLRRVMFSPDQRYLAAMDQRTDGKNVVHLFDTTSSEEILQVPALNTPEQVFPEDPAGLCFSNDSSRLAFSGGNGIRLVDIASRQVLDLSDPILPSGGRVQSFSTDTGSIFVNASEAALRCAINSKKATSISKHMLFDSWSWRGKDWILRRGEAYRIIAEPLDHSIPPIELSGMTELVFCGAISPNRRYVAAGGVDRSVRVWELQSRELVHTFIGHAGQIHQLTFTPDSSRVISLSGEDNTLRCWELTSRQEVMRLGGPSERLSCFDLTSDGTCIAVGYVGTGQSRVKFFPLTKDGERAVPSVRFDRPASITPLTGHATRPPVSFRLDRPLGPTTGFVRSIELSPSGQMAAIGNADGTVLIRDTDNWKTIFEGQINSIGVASLGFSEDETKLAVAHEDGIVAIINLDATPSISIIPSARPAAARVCFSLDGKHLAIGFLDGAIHICDLSERTILPGTMLQGEITKLVPLKGPSRLAASTRSGSVVIWDWEKDSIVAQLDAHRPVTDFEVLKDDETLLVPARSSFVKWHYPTGRILRSVSSTLGGYRSVDLLPGERSAMSLSLNGTKLRVLDVDTLTETTFASGLKHSVYELLWNKRTGVALGLNLADQSSMTVFGGTIHNVAAKATASRQGSAIRFERTIEDFLREDAPVALSDKRAKVICGDHSWSLPTVESLLRAINGYARRNGFAAAIPVAWAESWTPEQEFKICLLKKEYGEYREPNVSEFWGYPAESIISLDGHLGGIQERYRSAEAFAVRNRRKAALPLFSEKTDADRQVVYPTLLFRDTAEVREVDVTKLGSPMTTLATMEAVHAYSVQQGFGTGIPTFRRGISEGQLSLTVICLPKEVVDLRQVRLADLVNDGS